MKEKRGIRSAFRHTMIAALLACVMALVPSVAAHAKFENYSEGGTSTNNDHTGRYSGLSRSYLIDGKDGSFQRLEYSSDEGLFVETYTADFSYVAGSKKSIEMELPLFAGFYESDDNYFLVFGQNNMDESDTVEVIRVVKYDKSWNKLGAAQIFGANTQKPFAAGNVSMADDGTNLYLRTCHTMYKADDGYNHQASIMMQISISDMEVVYNNYTVANVAHGYVSHSFSQDIFYDDITGTVYATDRGDAHPRSHVLMKYTKLGSDYFSSTTSNVTIMSYGGETGDNYTGSYVSGLEVTGSTILSAGCSVDQSNYSSSTKKNVYVAVVDKAGYVLDKIVYLSAYTEDGTDNALRPYLVRVSDDVFAVLWETDISKGQVHYAFVDASGNILAAERTVSGTLSDMKPVVKGGNIIWYVTRQGSPVFYVLPATPGADIPTAEAGDTAKVNGLVYTLTEHEDGSLSAWVTGNEPGEVSITRLQIPDTVAINGGEYTVDGVGDKALSGLDSMYYAEFGANITHFGNNIFDGCTSLTTIKNNSTVKYTLPSSLGNTDKYLMYWRAYNSGSVGGAVSEISDGESAMSIFTSNKVTYKFDTDGGSTIDDITAFMCQPIDVPADPVKEGYVFGGWFTNDMYVMKLDLSTIHKNGYSGNVTFYAKWVKEVKSYTVASEASRTTYYEGVDTGIVPTGLSFEVEYTDGTTETITYGGVGSVSGHRMTIDTDSLVASDLGGYKPGTYEIKVEYENILYSYEVTVLAYEGNTPIVITKDSETQFKLTNGGFQYYAFTPEETGVYNIMSKTNGDSYGVLLDAVNGNELYRNDDSGGDRDFLITATLEAGKTYYLKARPYSTALKSISGYVYVYGETIKAGNILTRNGVKYQVVEDEAGEKSAWIVDVLDNETSTSFVTPTTITFPGTTLNVTGYGENALARCKSLKVLTVTSNITHVPDTLFDGLECLTQIVNQSSVDINLPVMADTDSMHPYGWKCDNKDATVVPAGKTAYLSYTNIKVTYKFNSNGGTDVADIIQWSGETISKPEDPVNEGYVFGGWFKDAAFTQKWDFDRDVTNAGYNMEVTLYAKWTYEIDLCEVVTPATNTVFNEHSKNINPEGLVMRFTYTDGDVETITYGQAGSKTGHVMTYSISTVADSNGYYKAGEYTITVEYEGCLYDYDITIETYTGNIPIEVQNNKPVAVELNADYQYYKFVAGFTGKYMMYTEGSCDTYGILYEEMEGTELTKDDDGGEGHNFMITRTLEEGKTYYLKVKPYNMNSGKITNTTLTIRLIPELTEVTLDKEGQTTYMEYIETGNYSSAPYYMANMNFVLHYETGETENIENGSTNKTKLGNAVVSYEIRKNGQKVSSVTNLTAGSYEKCLLIGGELKYSVPFTVTPISDNDLYEADRYYDNDVTDKMVVYGYTATKTGYVNVEFEAETGLTLNKLVDSEGKNITNNRIYFSYGSNMRTMEITFQATEGKTYYIAMNGFKSPYTMRIVSEGQQNRTNIKSLTVEAIETQLYNGSELKPQVEVKNGATVLTEGTDYEVVYKDNVNAGTATAEIRGMGAYGFRTFAEFVIQKKIGDCEVVITGEPEYTGSEVVPEDVKVYDGDKLLDEGTDYSLSYKDNVSAGTGTVTIAGMGLYIDTVDKEFAINKAANVISSEDIVLSYGGVSKSVTVSALEGAEAAFAVEDGSVAAVDETGNVTPVAVGSTKLTITVTETENYRQTSTEINVIVEKGDINGIAVYRAVKAGEETAVEIPVEEFLPALNDGLGYGDISVDVAGSELPAHVTDLKYEDGRLIISTDSELVDGDVITGTVSIVTGNYNVTDAQYVIETGAVDIQSGELTGIVDKEYTGESITQDVTVLLNGTPLSTTYYEVTYENNVNAGTATVVVYGRNGYSGTLRGTFAITPLDIQTAEVKLEKTQYEYTGSDICPVPEVIYNGAALARDEDYILIYSDNRAAGTATVTVRGIGNYAGDINVKFTIINNVPQLGKVSGIKATPAANTMKLEWSKLVDAQGYIVYRYSTASHKWERLGSTKNLFYYDRNLPSGTTQWYVVRGYVIVDGKTYMGPCDTANPYKTTTLPGAVNFKLSSTTKGQVSVTWSAVTGATSYAVYYKTSANGKWQRLTVTKDLKYSKSGFNSGSTYYFTVRAYRQYGSTGYPGAYSAKTVKVK